MTSLDIPADWRRSAERILAGRWRTILVLGASDRGKSSYCSALAQALCAAGSPVDFVDADIGQKDVGPPATVSLARVRAGRPLSQARLTALYFVGAVNPIGHFLPLIVGTRRMLDVAQAPFVIVDTTGLIHGPGRWLKASQIDLLQPQVIVAIEQGRELEEVLRPQRHRAILRLAPSGQARRKSNALRAAARAQAFARYFAGARPQRMAIDGLVFQRSPLFNGEPRADPRFVYAEQTVGGLVAVGTASGSGPPGTLLAPGFETGLLCALADRRERVLGLGIIDRFDFTAMTVSLSTPAPPARARILQMGTLRLRPDGTELRPGRR